MVKSHKKIVFQIIVSSLFLYVCIFNLNWEEVTLAFAKVDISMYIFSLIVGLGGTVVLALKYAIMIKDSSLNLSVLRLIAINFITRFYALFLPSGIGREVVRWFKVTKNKEERIFFLASIFFERIVFLLILLLFSIIPLYIYTSNANVIILRQQLMPVILCCCALIVFTLAFFISSFFQNSIKNFIKYLFSIFSNNRQWVDWLDQLSVKNTSVKVLYSLFFLTIVWEIIYISRIFILFSSLDLAFNIIDVVWISSLVLFLQVIPISFSGIGLREGAYAYLFSLYGLPPEKGLVIGLLFFTQMLFYAAVGFIFNAFEK